tara:strand:+ start:496 stop:708 length:213 start_codon:yes stop_codon:yes gene_type:complete
MTSFITTFATTFFRGLLRFRRGPWEMVATILIAFGVIMLMQPFVLGIYSYSFIVTLVGTVMFIIVSHFPE